MPIGERVEQAAHQPGDHALVPVQFQFNNYQLANGHWNNNWQFQPVLPGEPHEGLEPHHAAGDAPLQHRPARDGPRRSSRHTAGLGDMVLLELLSPANTGHVGPRGGTDLHLPDGDVEVHRAGQVCRPDPASWWATSRRSSSSACFPSSGSPSEATPDRPDTSQMNLQPIAAIFFGDGWSVGYSGNILANWKADSGDIWTVPVGARRRQGREAGASAGQAPAIGLQYMPVRPQDVGQEWNVQVSGDPRPAEAHQGASFKRPRELSPEAP